LEIVVSDNGPGIRPSVRDLVFQPFYTTKGVLRKLGQDFPSLGELKEEETSSTSSSSSVVKGGAGLGLSLSRALAEGQGGTLTLLERGQLPGASFCLRLPLAAAHKF
jgi:signal transduction histidine kinase